MDIINLDYSAVVFLQQKVGGYKTRNLRYMENKYRYIQFWTKFEGESEEKDNIHYEVINGYIELHFEGDTAEKETPLIDYLQKKTSALVQKGELEWFKRNTENQTKERIDACRLTKRCQSKDEAAEGLLFMKELFDKHIQVFQFPHGICHEARRRSSHCKR